MPESICEALLLLNNSIGLMLFLLLQCKNKAAYKIK